MKRLLAVALLLLPCIASAATVTLTVTLPTSYDEGSPLDVANIVSRRVEWTGACPSFSFIAPANSIVYPGNSATIVVQNVTAGTRCFRVYVTARDPRCVVSATQPCTPRESQSPSPIWTMRVVDGPDPDPAPIVLRAPNPPTGLTGRQ